MHLGITMIEVVRAGRWAGAWSRCARVRLALVLRARPGGWLLPGRSCGPPRRRLPALPSVAVLAASACRLLPFSGTATVGDYAVSAIKTGDLGGENFHSLIMGAIFDVAGYGLGRAIEIKIEAVQSLKAPAGSVVLRAAGGAGLVLGQDGSRALVASYYAARGISQSLVDNYVRLINYDYGTLTCTNPIQTPGFCPGG